MKVYGDYKYKEISCKSTFIFLRIVPPSALLVQSLDQLMNNYLSGASTNTTNLVNLVTVITVSFLSPPPPSSLLSKYLIMFTNADRFFCLSMRHPLAIQ